MHLLLKFSSACILAINMAINIRCSEFYRICRDHLNTTLERILKRVYGPVKGNCIWRSRFNHKLLIYNLTQIDGEIKAGRLRLLRQLCRIQ
jgi:hypothetical protein